MADAAYVDQVFNTLHEIPEEGFKEFKTAAFIAEELRKCGYDVKEQIAETGIVARLDSGKPGPVLALRADMDALPFEIKGERVWIHACGHDANASMILAAAKEIAQEGIGRGSILFVFQPAEEKGLGAKAMAESGLLDQVEEMVAIHLRPVMEARLGQASPALCTGAIAQMKVEITGMSAHGAWPHKGINAIDAGVMVVNAIKNVYGDPRISHSAKVTQFHSGGNALNIIPDKVSLGLDVRAQTNQVMDDLVGKLKEAIEYAGKSAGAEIEIQVPMQFDAADFDADLQADLKGAIETVLGSALDPIVTPGAEDFHYYRQILGVKTAYAGLGADVTTVLHHPDMSFDKKALHHGRDIMIQMVRRRLGE